MGKLNEIQQQSTQSYGGNSFTTKIEENTVVFDSAKDNFKFNDPVDVPELTINGQPVEPGGAQPDWDQTDDTKADFIKNKPAISTEGNQIVATQPIISKFNDYSYVRLVNAQSEGRIEIGVPGTPQKRSEKVSINGSGVSFASVEAPYTSYFLSFPELTDHETIAVKSDIVQSDWNQSDSTKADFIKNRIAYDVIEENHTFINETNELEYEELEISSFNGNLILNETYTFTINNQEYTLNCVIDDNWSSEKCLEWGDTEDKENEYIIIWSYSGIWYLDTNVIPSDDATAVEIKLTGKSITTTKIDERFLLNSNIKNGNGFYSVEEGEDTTASGDYSHAEGYRTEASGEESHAEGANTEASGKYSHSEGVGAIASGDASHAEGNGAEASGDYSHAEGYQTTASGKYSHSECRDTTASGDYSHAEGNTTTASGDYSHTEGYKTTANHKSQHVFGEYNILDNSSAASTERGEYVEIVGNGYYDRTSKTNILQNARTLDWNGNEEIAGTLKIGSTSSTGGAILKVESNSLKISFDNGTTWQTVTLS